MLLTKGVLMKIVISEKEGKSYSLDIDKEKEVMLYGKKIGEEVQGDLIGLPGYTLKIMGGSDISGFPMRHDISGNRRAKVLMARGAGLQITGKLKQKLNKGDKHKRMLRGSSIGEGIVSLNFTVAQAGSVSLAELCPKKEGDKKDKK